MRKPLIPALLFAAALLATLCASTDWLRLDGAPEGHGYGFFTSGGQRAD